MMITQKRCWQCQKMETGSVEWKFCPYCSTAYEDSDRQNTQNVPTVEDNYVTGYKAWKDRNQSTL